VTLARWLLHVTTSALVVLALVPRVACAQRAQARVPADSAAALAGTDSAPPELRSVQGRIVRPAGRSEQPVVGAWVVLHRVGPDRAAPLDSVRSGPGGAFSFRYQTSGSVEAIYFVSAMHHGIAYFSSPLRERDTGGPAAEILVFDTSSIRRAVGVQGRHVVVSAPQPTGRREVVEVYELSNDTTVTLVSSGDDHPIWTTIVPAGARDFRVSEGELGGDALTLRDGRVRLYAPVAPGVKQLSFTYTLADDAFPLSVPAGVGISVLEVLLEEPNAAASGASLREQAPATVSGRTFRRYLGQDVPHTAVVRIVVPAAPATGRTLWLAAVGTAIGAAMLVALARAMTRKPARAALATAPLESEQVLAEIATLDDAFDRVPRDDEASRADYEARRATLKDRLARALAEERRRP